MEVHTAQLKYWVYQKQQVDRRKPEPMPPATLLFKPLYARCSIFSNFCNFKTQTSRVLITKDAFQQRRQSMKIKHFLNSSDSFFSLTIYIFRNNSNSVLKTSKHLTFTQRQRTLWGGWKAGSSQVWVRHTTVFSSILLLAGCGWDLRWNEQAITTIFA